jgi:DNA-directed RNA polymerase specialized sigma24 family protein
MADPDVHKPVNELLLRWKDGEDKLEALLPDVYDELRRLAHHYLRRERPGHALQSTALVNEAYLRLAAQQPRQLQNRGHFIAVAAQLMRRILVDDKQQARVVELRFFGGLSIEDTSEILGISPGTVKRDWCTARAWLYREMDRTAPS